MSRTRSCNHELTSHNLGTGESLGTDFSDHLLFLLFSNRIPFL